MSEQEAKDHLLYHVHALEQELANLHTEFESVNPQLSWVVNTQLKRIEQAINSLRYGIHRFFDGDFHG